MPTVVMETRNYDKFELCAFNRDVEKIKYLEASMRQHGWIPAYPMHVEKNGSGILKIKAGHHRFEVARKLGISVKYVLCNDTATIHELERATIRWDMEDYLVSHARTGKEDYIAVERFHNTTGINLNACLSMLAGQSAGSHNIRDSFKDGNFKVKTTEHAGTIADIVLHAKKCGIKWAHNAIFVNALSRIAWAEGFESAILKRKISAFPYLLEKQPSLVHYTEMIEHLYNYHSPQRIPLAYLADEAARKRNAIKSTELPEKKKSAKN